VPAWAQDDKASREKQTNKNGHESTQSCCIYSWSFIIQEKNRNLQHSTVLWEQPLSLFYSFIQMTWAC